MFPSLAARETYVAETNFAARKQKVFLPGVKNIFASRTQILRPKHMFSSLATVKTMFMSFQCRSLSNKVTKGVDVHKHIMFERWKVFSRQFCYDACIGPSLHFSSQPISM